MKNKIHVLLLAGSLLAAQFAQGVSITVTNAGFEASTQNMYDGFDNATYDIPAWKDVDTNVVGTATDSGVQIGTPWFGVHSGVAACFCKSEASGNDPGMYQMTGYTIQDGDLFTIGFWAKAWTANAEWTATLIFDDGTIQDIGSYTTPTLNNGGSYVYYESDPIAATAGSVGHAVGIRLVNTGADGSFANIDDISINTYPFSISVSPTETSTETNQTVEATIVDINETLVSATLSLDGMAVATNSTPSGTTNTVSYAATGLSIGVHTGQVVAVGSTESVTNTWTFQVDAIPPEANGILYNINFAGNTGSHVDLPAGIILNAGSAGSNLWNNVIAPTVDSATPSEPITITNATDGSSSIGLSWYGVTHDFASSTAGTPLLPLNQGWYGSGGTDTNRTVEISGLDINAVYDIYCYFTWRWDQGAVTYNITEGTGAVTNLTLQANWSTANPSLGYDGYVEGSNYVHFVNITPSEAGQIDINALSANGGFSGLQVVKKVNAPDFAPTITSVAVSGGSVTIYWDSDTIGTYRIESKTSLTSPTWNPVAGATGLNGGTGKSTSFSVSGDPAEFFRVYGE